MTGSGKTLIYLLPILQKLSVDPYGIFAVIFLPSRELALQIEQQFTFYGAKMNLRISVLIGGNDYIKQTTNLDNIPHLIIATPGRFFEVVENNQFIQKYLRNVKVLVFDEFDKLLQDSFFYFLDKILTHLPKQRQTILTTATFEESLLTPKELEEKFKITGTSLNIFNLNQQLKVVETLSHYYLFLPNLRRDYYFIHLLLQEYQPNQGNDFEKSIIVFFNRCR